jgi:hypothetical protein
MSFYQDQGAGEFDKSGAPGQGGAKGTGAVPKNDSQPYQEAIRESITLALKPFTDRLDANEKAIKAQTELAQKTADEDACRQLFESLDRECDKLSLDAAMAIKDPAQRKALIERFPAKDKPITRFAPRPATSPSLLEAQASDAANVTIPKGESFKAAVMNGAARRVSVAG